MNAYEDAERLRHLVETINPEVLYVEQPDFSGFRGRTGCFVYKNMQFRVDPQYLEMLILNPADPNLLINCVKDFTDQVDNNLFRNVKERVFDRLLLESNPCEDNIPSLKIADIIAFAYKTFQDKIVSQPLGTSSSIYPNVFIFNSDTFNRLEGNLDRIYLDKNITLVTSKLDTLSASSEPYHRECLAYDCVAYSYNKVNTSYYFRPIFIYLDDAVPEGKCFVLSDKTYDDNIRKLVSPVFGSNYSINLMGGERDVIYLRYKNFVDYFSRMKEEKEKYTKSPYDITNAIPVFPYEDYRGLILSVDITIPETVDLLD